MEQRSHPTLTVAMLATAGMAYTVMAPAVNPALPTIQRDLHASETGITFLLTGYLLSASVGTGILGRLGDMLGKKRVLVWTMMILAAGTLLAGLAYSLPVLIAARVIQGVGGGIFPLSFGIIRDELPRERVPGAIGLLSSMLSIGGSIGLVIGGLVVEHLGWHALFWVPLAVTLVGLVVIWRWIPESPVRAPGRINWTAAALMSAGIATLLIGISKATDWGWGSPKTLGLIGIGLALCALWVRVESRSDEPLIDMQMMRLRGIWTINVVSFLLGAGMYALFFVLPQFLQQPESTGYGFGASIVQSGLYVTPTTIGVLLTGTSAGWVARRFGSRWATIVGSALGCVSLTLITVRHDSPWEVLLSMGIFGLGIGLSFAALGNLVVEAVDPHQTGAAGGMNTVLRLMGGAIGGQIAATFIAANIGEDGHPELAGFVHSWALQALFLFVATLAALLVPRRRPFASPLLEADAAPEGAL
jgi:EmrB/QacA subfamily drug resistance transporter